MRQNSSISTSPLAEISSGQHSSPITPSPNVRVRKAHNTGSPDHSPSTTISGSDTLPTSLMNEIPHSTFRSIFASSTNTNRSLVLARSDPSLLTCFDPSDKELYDLWAPQRD